MISLIRSELLKLRTVRTWWIATVAVAASTLVTLLWNCWQASIFMQPFDEYLSEAILRPRNDIPPEQLEILRQLHESQSDLGRIAVNVYTSGQFVGLLVCALLAILLVTNEYHHRTATATFLVTPRRERAIVAKLAAAMLVATALWLVSTVINLVVGALFLVSQHVGTQLANPDVVVSVLLNLAAFVVWAIFGFGFGALIRNQVAATVGVTVLYLLTSVVITLVFRAIYETVIEEDWVLKAQVIVPAVASQVMTTPGSLFPQAPPQWTGAVVLIGYGLVFGLLGTFYLRRRDVS